MKLGELVQILSGKLAQGSPEFVVNGVNSSALASATELVFAEDAQSAAKALASSAGVVLLRAGLAEAYPEDKCVVEAEQPRLWFAWAGKLLDACAACHRSASCRRRWRECEARRRGEHRPLRGGRRECLHRQGNAHRGRSGHRRGRAHRRTSAGSIHAQCSIRGLRCGNRVIVHAGAVLGADGFGYVRDEKTGAYTQFPQQGTLLIEDDVEIGANTTIDRGALKQTRIGRGTKTDNLVHVGHNCEIGEDVILVTGVGISGSCTVGNGAVIAGQVGIGDHAHIGPGVILGGQAGVLSGKTVTNEGMGVKPGTVLWGTPARPLKQVLREMAVLARLAKKQGTGNRE